METTLEAPRFKAIIEKKIVTVNRVKIFVRYHKRHWSDQKRKTFLLTVHRGKFLQHEELYQTAKNLHPGDEIFVDGYGKNWSSPIKHNALMRFLKLHFA